MTRDELITLAKQYGRRITVGEDLCVVDGNTSYDYYSLLIDGVCVKATAMSWQECANHLPDYPEFKQREIAELREKLQALESGDDA